ncbi:hypothetical protein AXW67_00210 [Bradyrhizobium neotropicale]|uniref:Uncharacterized protein n=1 Tax=Bradyrhizobium neotropicale TaxID=1497615 RepID=A0A176Z887_9BRAD|nr:hypothetical protein AXW67_00210 [Bradyrhizobium neotropicale]
MAVERIARARGFAIRIYVQHDPNNLFPIGTVGFGVEETPIGHQMLLVIGCKCRLIRSDIRNDR